MKNWKKPSDLDNKEFELPETVFVRDIEDQVFKTIVLNCLGKIDGVTLDGGGFFDNLFGREVIDGVKGVHVTQHDDSPSVSLKVEVKIQYGYSIPEKTDEIQAKISHEITEYTGLHVSGVHVVVKKVYPEPAAEVPETPEAALVENSDLQ